MLLNLARIGQCGYIFLHPHNLVNSSNHSTMGKKSRPTDDAVAAQLRQLLQQKDRTVYDLHQFTGISHIKRVARSLPAEFGLYNVTIAGKSSLHIKCHAGASSQVGELQSCSTGTVIVAGISPSAILLPHITVLLPVRLCC